MIFSCCVSFSADSTTADKRFETLDETLEITGNQFIYYGYQIPYEYEWYLTLSAQGNTFTVPGFHMSYGNYMIEEFDCGGSYNFNIQRGYTSGGNGVYRLYDETGTYRKMRVKLSDFINAFNDDGTLPVKGYNLSFDKTELYRADTDNNFKVNILDATKIQLFLAQA